MREREGGVRNIHYLTVDMEEELLTKSFSLLILPLPSAVDVIRSMEAKSPTLAYSHNGFGMLSPAKYPHSGRKERSLKGCCI
jgi:hypothetical protein